MSQFLTCSHLFALMLQELIPLAQSDTRVFEQIHILAVAGLRNVDWTAITVGQRSSIPKHFAACLAHLLCLLLHAAYTELESHIASSKCSSTASLSHILI